MIAVIVLLVLVAGAVGGGIILVRRRQEDGSSAGTPGTAGHSVRRFFQYFLLLGLLLAAASGVTGLLGRGVDLLDRFSTIARDDDLLALQLTFTFIALPLWLALAWWTHRRAAEDPGELRSTAWATYLTLAGLIALVTAVVGWTRTLWGLTGGDVRGSVIALAAVWTVVWAGHLWWGRQGTPKTQLRVRDLASSLIGLGVAAYGLAQLVASTLRVLTGLEIDVVVTSGAQPLLRAGSLLAVGAAVWAVHWLLDLVHGPRTTGWLTLVLLFGVGGGLLLALGTLSVVLHQVLVWLVGDPGSPTAAQHFSSTPGHIGVAVAGLLVWWYHQAVLDAGRAAERTEVRRVYEYVMSAVGLLAAAGGLVMVLVTLVEAIAAGRDLVVGGSALNTLLAALVLLAVGSPVWLWHWRLAQQARAAAPAQELRSVSRRTYLLVLFGVMGVAAVIALLVLVYLVLRDLLDGDAGLETLRQVRVPLGILATTSLLSAYHWTIFREDRRAGEQLASTQEGTEPQGPRRVLLVADLSPAELADVAARAGVLVQQWRPTDGSPTPTVDQVVAALESAPDPGAGGQLILAGAGAGDGDGDGVRVLPVTPSAQPAPPRADDQH